MGKHSKPNQPSVNVGPVSPNESVESKVAKFDALDATLKADAKPKSDTPALDSYESKKKGK